MTARACVAHAVFTGLVPPAPVEVVIATCTEAELPGGRVIGWHGPSTWPAMGQVAGPVAPSRYTMVSDALVGM